MIGGGFRGNFPGKGNEKKKHDSALGPIQKNANAHDRAKAFVEHTPGVTPSNKPHVSGFTDNGARVLPSPHGNADPVSPASGVPAPLGHRRTEVLWNGIVHGVSGYSKANREIVKRLDSTLRVRFSPQMHFLDSEADQEAKEIYSAHKRTDVSNSAPRVTFLPPRVEPKAAHRIIYTMMETEIVHPDMIRLMNENYEECWTPTHWNGQTFRQSGLRLPINVMPLGVDPAIYSPSLPARMPMSTLMSTHEYGKTEQPAGFIFCYVFQPSMRKGLDFLLSAFEEAFFADQEAGLLLGTTGYALQGTGMLPNRDMKTRVWALQGKYTERDLAGMYRACKVYVCTSRGEGWNMPVTEAAACGLPVIVPRTTVHPELVPSGYGLFFDQDDYRVFPEAKKISPWFEGIPFPDYGVNSKRMLVELLRTIKKEYSTAQIMGKRYSGYVRSKYTWGTSARLIGDRLKAIQA
jgi:glycosyltransferase involved in cell wall biosynthesis